MRCVEQVLVYEILRLARFSLTTPSELIDEQENKITISIDSMGQLRFSSSNGSTGTAVISQAFAFALTSEAALQFNGNCEQGIITISGNITGSNISGSYSSDGLICGQDSFELSGTFDASR